MSSFPQTGKIIGFSRRGVWGRLLILSDTINPIHLFTFFLYLGRDPLSSDRLPPILLRYNCHITLFILDVHDCTRAHIVKQSVSLTSIPSYSYNVSFLC